MTHQSCKTKVQSKATVPQKISGKLVDIEAKIKTLEENRKKAHFQAKLKQLRAKKALKFPTHAKSLTEKEVVAPIKAKQFALEQTKCIQMPNIYKKKF